MKTTAPELQSFVAVDPESHFPIQNLPYGAFIRPDAADPHVGVRIGDYLLDLTALAGAGVMDESGSLPASLFQCGNLNPILAAGRTTWTALRERVSRLLRQDEPRLRDDVALRAHVLLPIDAVTMQLPVAIGDYTDFYSSKEHATNVGIMFRGKENALLPNWAELPVAYHGRASSVVTSGTPIRRPCGQTLPGDAQRPVFGPCGLLDFELEMGFFTGPGNELGRPIPIGAAQEHIFGLVLVNDWSARDIQKWEYQPLGPFTAKNFATSISPWVVPLDALGPFRTAGPAQNPEPLPYLRDREPWAFNIELEVLLQTATMNAPQSISRSNFRHLYWNMRQQLAHHTITGCNLRPGDMMASGTISAPEPTGYGSLLELTWRGTRPIALPGGEERAFLADGDTVILTGWCQGDGFRVGFGEVTGRILPALDLP